MNKFETAVLDELSVFEPLKFYSNMHSITEVQVIVVVVLLFYDHGKHLRSFRDGQLT